MRTRPTLLAVLPDAWKGLWQTRLTDGSITLIRHGRPPYDRAPYDPAAIDYVLSFQPPAGLLASLPNLKAVFSMGAGVDGFFLHGDYPAAVPLIRFTDETLSAEMAQYVLLHVLAHHRSLRGYDRWQGERRWVQEMLPRRTEDTRIGMLGLGTIGTFAAELFVKLGFPVAGWSRSGKSLPGIASFAGLDALPSFFAATDICICLLPLTPETEGILNADAFAAMPEGAFIVNAARGRHVVVPDLIAALDRGHLSGAVLDVFETEPLPTTSPLWTHPKVAVTPHIAAISQPSVAADYVMNGIAAFERGEMPPGRVDIANGY